MEWCPSVYTKFTLSNQFITYYVFQFTKWQESGLRRLEEGHHGHQWAVPGHIPDHQPPQLQHKHPSKRHFHPQSHRIFHLLTRKSVPCMFTKCQCKYLLLIFPYFPHEEPVLEIRIRGMGRHHHIWMGHHNIWRLHLQHTAICQSSSSFWCHLQWASFVQWSNWCHHHDMCR